MRIICTNIYKGKENIFEYLPISLEEISLKFTHFNYFLFEELLISLSDKKLKSIKKIQITFDIIELTDCII